MSTVVGPSMTAVLLMSRTMMIDRVRSGGSGIMPSSSISWMSTKFRGICDSC